MGGPNYSTAETVSLARAQAAMRASDLQIKQAKELYELHFSRNSLGDQDPQLIAAIMQMLATNYSAFVVSNGG